MRTATVRRSQTKVSQLSLPSLAAPEEVVESDDRFLTTSVQERLAAIDWSFDHRECVPAIEAIHPYPAKFIGDLPRALLEILPCPENTIIFDPFAGSGTTLVEAQRCGIPSVGVDLNPCRHKRLVAYGKTRTE